MRPHLVSLIEDCLRRRNELAFARWKGLRVERWSYQDLARVSFQFAGELSARNIGRGDRVIFLAQNSPAWVAAFFGCMMRGAVAVPLDTHSSAEFVLKVQDQVAAKLVLADSSTLRASRLTLPVINLDDLPEIVSEHNPTIPSTETINRSDLIEIIFTSGTTSEPKGVQLTHENFLANLAPIEGEMKKYLRYERLVHPIRFLSLVPLSHIFGQLMGMFIPMLMGGPVFYRRAHTSSDTISAIRRERISVLIAVPRMLASLADAIRREVGALNKKGLEPRLAGAAGQSGLRRWWTFRDVHKRFGLKFWAFITGGAELDASTEEFWRGLGFAVLQGYGMTETASLISIPHPFRSVNRSIGKALPGQEVRVDQSGEILIRGSNVTPGYWAGESLHPIDSDGWLHTGDIGEVDAQGNIYFKGRSKDVINLASGLKVYPEDLEQALLRQPEIKHAAVIGVTGKHGPEPLAVLILRDRSVNAQEVVNRANHMLSEPQRIRRWSIWPDEDFPRTPTTQKILKRVIAERIGTQGDTLQSPAGLWTGDGNDREFLRQQLTRILGAAPGKLGSENTLGADLKLDSLDRVELMSAIEERYQITIDEGAIRDSTTVGDLAQLVRSDSQNAYKFPDPSWARSPLVALIRRLFLRLVVVPAERILSGARATGTEHLRDVNGPVIFASNHVSSIDAGLILASLPSRFRDHLAIAMHGEMLREWRYPDIGKSLFERIKLRVKYWLVTGLFHVFPLPQQSGYRRSFAYAGESLERGDSVLIFPEGRRTLTGEMGPFLPGAGLLAAQADAPVVPVRIHGLFDLKKKRRFSAPRGRIQIVFGRPLRFDSNQPADAIAREIERQVRELKER
ncbi:MAG: AMP-binding protein [Blastocatellales bacterium]|nr:AMP-binding protein [Blastocatellales bacterium]